MPNDSLDQPNWTRRCADAACVELAAHREAVLMRDSKDSAGPVLSFTREQWASFWTAVVAGEFDRS